MSVKRSHVHRRVLGNVVDADLASELKQDKVIDNDEGALPTFRKQRRVVTVYETQTPDGWDGIGPLTTLARATVTQVVQQTITATEGDEPTPTPAENTPRVSIGAPAIKGTPTSSNIVSSSSISRGGGDDGDDDTSSSLPSAIMASTAASDSATGPLALATEAASTSSTSRSPAAAGSTAASEASATQSVESSSGSGSSNAASKAGIAIGVLAGIFVILGLVYFVVAKRKRQMREEQRLADDEKLNGPFGDHARAPPTPAKPPRLSLRPMTQLFLAPAAAEKRASKGPQQNIAMVASPTMKRAPGASPWERPMTSDSQDAQNPFGNHAETIPEEPATPRNPASPMTPISEVSMIASPAAAPAPLQMNPTGPVASAPATSEVAAASTAAAAAGAAGAAGGVTAASGLRRKESVRKDHVPAPLDLTVPPKLGPVPPSPAGTEFSVHEVESGQDSEPSAGAAAIAAAGGPADSSVHRVQLDFKPTMDDEMELHVGQVVRLLHEYDDGWALCIRLDRSQQGVVPRTCLSTRPVKPRPPQQAGPRGPPVKPQGRPRGPSVSSQRGPGPNQPPGNRPMGPPGGQPHPLAPGARGPGQMRPMGPPGRPGPPRPMGPQMGPGPRPRSPAGQRPQSPAQRPQSPSGQGPPRSQSPNGASRRPSPPGPSGMQQEYRPSFDGPSQAPPQGPPSGPPQGPPQGAVTRKPVPGQAY
ncbi:hypothetical protein F5883DRAFT_433717 [Diaporthe sp. PMI_573]|nr:hypothetical protein F5883DRAFT_433717 [Diaporthaceae sp. PMI_573]